MTLRDSELVAMELELERPTEAIVSHGDGATGVSSRHPVIPSSRPVPQQSVVVGGRVLPSRYFLAPLAGYTNWALRQTVRELGGLGLATSDLVNARALLQGGRKTLELTHTTPDDRPMAIQLYGSE